MKKNPGLKTTPLIFIAVEYLNFVLYLIMPVSSDTVFLI